MLYKPLVFLLFFSCFTFAENTPAPEQRLKSASGRERINVLLNISNYYLKKDPNKSLYASKEALESSKKIGDAVLRGRALYFIGKYNYLQGNNKIALSQFKEALKFFERNNSSLYSADSRIEISAVQRLLGNFEEALDEAVASLKIYDSLQNKSGLARTYSELGLVYRNLNRKDEALSYFLTAYHIAKAADNMYECARAVNFIGNYYFFSGNINTADSCYTNALSILKKINVFDDLYSGLLNNKGNCARDRSDFADANDYYKKSMAISIRLGDKNLKAVTSKNIGICLKKQNKYQEALQVLEKAYILSDSIELKRFKRDILLEISNVYRLTKQYDKALEYHVLYSALNDSIFHEDMGNKVSKYTQLVGHYSQKESHANFQLSQAIFLRDLLIVILLVVIATFFLLYYFYNLNKTSNKKINRQKEKLLMLNEELNDKNRELEEFKELVNRTKAIIVLWKKENGLKVEFISRNVSNHLGYTDSELISGEKDWNSLIHPDDFNHVMESLNENIANNITENVLQYRIINSLGEYKWFEDYNKIVTNFETKEVFIQAIVLEINERKILEQQLENYTLELKELNKVKDKFFSIVAHDLKSPFFGLVGLSNMLTEEFDTFDLVEIKEYTASMNTLLKRVYTLIENLLDWSRMQQNKYEINRANINVYEVCAKVVELLLISASSKDISIENLLPANLQIISDDKMLFSILSNFISNAIKFTNRNGKIKIYLSPDEKVANQAVITVEDNGIGISREDIENVLRIDKHFSTAGTAGEIGTGLGLIITKEMIEKLGGKVIIKSEPGKWSKFSFTMPMA